MQSVWHMPGALFVGRHVPALKESNTAGLEGAGLEPNARRAVH